LATPDTLSSPVAGMALTSLRWLLALGVATGSVAAGTALLRLEPQLLPVRVVTVDGAVSRLSAPVLARTVTDNLQGGMLTQDLRVLRQAVTALPWVHTASLRRVWPDQVRLEVTEHQPIARWGEDGLATAAGLVFRPGRAALLAGLPRLEGGDDMAPQVVANYLHWSERLAPLGLKVAAVTRDPRGAWTLGLVGGLRLELGSVRVEDRLARFMRTYPQIAAAGRAERVDLRYANGLAVSWSAAAGDEAVAQAEAVEARATEPKAARGKATVPGEARNKLRNKG
jgi:cell division protein FtsQ